MNTINKSSQVLSALSNKMKKTDNKLHKKLTIELSKAGCFKRAPMATVGMMIFILTIYSICYYMLLFNPEWIIRIPILMLLAFTHVQAGFIAHEAGHGAITRNHNIAELIGQIFNTFLTAECYSHFQYIHRSHHPHCNEEGKDIDMQSGIFSMYENSARRKTRLGKLITHYQAYLIWILVSLQGFSLKIDSLNILRRNPDKTRTDQIVLIFHFLLWFSLPVAILDFQDALLNYFFMTLFVGPYLGFIFLVNHIGTRIIRPDEKVSHFYKQLTTTRNLGDSRLSDFIFGGLNNHIEHHLFPSMATARLRTARPIVRDFCRRHGLIYREMNWLTAAREVFNHFKEMSKYTSKSSIHSTLSYK